jgi:predicted component of type VI protein secretion system
MARRTAIVLVLCLALFASAIAEDFESAMVLDAEDLADIDSPQSIAAKHEAGIATAHKHINTAAANALCSIDARTCTQPQVKKALKHGKHLAQHSVLPKTKIPSLKGYTLPLLSKHTIKRVSTSVHNAVYDADRIIKAKANWGYREIDGKPHPTTRAPKPKATHAPAYILHKKAIRRSDWRDRFPKFAKLHPTKKRVKHVHKKKTIKHYEPRLMPKKLIVVPKPKHIKRKHAKKHVKSTPKPRKVEDDEDDEDDDEDDEYVAVKPIIKKKIIRVPWYPSKQRKTFKKVGTVALGATRIAPIYQSAMHKRVVHAKQQQQQRVARAHKMQAMMAALKKKELQRKKAVAAKKAVQAKINKMFAKKAHTVKKFAAKKVAAVKKFASKKAAAVKQFSSKKATAVKKFAAKKVAAIKKFAAKKVAAVKKFAAKKAEAAKQVVAKPTKAKANYKWEVHSNKWRAALVREAMQDAEEDD